MQIVFLTQDLMTSAGVASALRAAGAEVKMVMSPEACLSAVKEQDAQAVVVDLQSLSASPGEFFASLRGVAPSSLLIAAYAQHVYDQLLDEARQHGVELVMTRGQFHRGGASVLIDKLRLAPSPPSP